MNNVFNAERENWIRPWEQEKFDDLYNRDERFFSLVIKGLLSWLNRNIVLYNKSIKHFVFNTGSSYLYIESNGYEYTLSETTGEDTMYMTLPRCIIELTDVGIPMEELTAPFSRGNYERRSGNQLQGYNAEIRRLPLELTINLKYYLSNYNEILILLQEIFDKLIFQRYYNITYLGKILQCSIEFPANMNPEINKIDMSSPDPNQRNITFDIKVCTNYPVIDERTAIPTNKVIGTFGQDTSLYKNNTKTDNVKKGEIINNDLDDFNKFKNDLINPKDVIDYHISDADSLADIINRFDLNDDGVLDEFDLESILEKIKYEAYEESSDYDSSTRLNYTDVYNAIKLMNEQENISAQYDKFTNKIYVTHEDTGRTAEINMAKYKVINKIIIK